MGSLMNRVLMAYRPLYLRGLLMDGQYRLLPSPEPPPRGRGAQAAPPASQNAAGPSGLLAGTAIAAAARRQL
ncbi:hypothetical protein RKE25_00895 [Dyella sp. BiH032]|uniref:hypothetical protein n=1 Tax=Dyella sp. BiH032 TaxID=3075430 RepID=UPI002892ECE1|nr:hypothetical protein [Dyella sp. BiH032]WNL46220.1 hypothetical protein RKE25_00895 [Dyella sp. BiH032]